MSGTTVMNVRSLIYLPETWHEVQQSAGKVLKAEGAQQWPLMPVAPAPLLHAGLHEHADSQP